MKRKSIVFAILLNKDWALTKLQVFFLIMIREMPVILSVKIWKHGKKVIAESGFVKCYGSLIKSTQMM